MKGQRPKDYGGARVILCRGVLARSHVPTAFFEYPPRTLSTWISMLAHPLTISACLATSGFCAPTSRGQDNSPPVVTAMRSQQCRSVLYERGSVLYNSLQSSECSQQLSFRHRFWLRL